MQTNVLPNEIVHGRPRLPDSWERAVLLIDKPKGWSSFDVIRRLRRLLPQRKIGHSGTLDPMATGLLICLMGRATKLMTSFMELDKVYEGTLRLGETTPSYDAETEVSQRRDATGVSTEDLKEATELFLGQIVQATPAYSAIKVKGERSYRKARRGETADRPPRQVRVDAFELTDRRGGDVDFMVRCSKGTYIRSLAHDLGEAVGVGAHLVALRRTSIGPFEASDAWTIDALAETLAER